MFDSDMLDTKRSSFFLVYLFAWTSNYFLTYVVKESFPRRLYASFDEAKVMSFHISLKIHFLNVKTAVTREIDIVEC